MKTKKSTSLRNFVTAIVLAAALLAAGALWVLLGWRGALDVTLTDLAGDPAALRGFTMRGQSRLDSAHTYWELHDGYLDTAFALDPDGDEEQYRYGAPGVTMRTIYALTPESRAAVDAAARRVHTYADSWQLESTASAFRVMAEIYMADGVLRVALRDAAADEPVAVTTCAEAPSYLARTSSQYDYEADSPEQLQNMETDCDFIAGQLFSLGGGQGLVWKRTIGSRRAGLYRATPVSYEALEALPADGKAGDREVLCATTEVGTLEPFYCPEDARLVACGLPMADGLTLCVYINKEEKACADLVNAAGVRVDHVELAELAGQSDFSAVARPRSTDHDAVLHIYGDDYSGYLTALRVENGSFALHQCLPVGESVYLRNAEAAVLNTAGDALLIATPEYTTVGEGGADNAYNMYQTGTLLLVTHDRHLMNSLACPILYLEDGKATLYPSYDALMGRSAPAPAVQKAAEPAKTGYGREQRRRRAELRAKIKACEDEMEACGAREVELDNEINSPEVYNDPDLLRQKSDELSDLRFHQEELFAAWEKAMEEQEQYEQAAGEE